MKVLGWKAILVLILSMGLWWALYVTFPSAPPDPADSTVIVGMMLVLVLGASSLLSKVRKHRAGPAAAEEAPQAEAAAAPAAEGQP